MGISQADADEIKRLTIEMLRCFESQMLHGDKKLEPGPSQRLFTFVDSLTFEPPDLPKPTTPADDPLASGGRFDRVGRPVVEPPTIALLEYAPPQFVEKCRDPGCSCADLMVDETEPVPSAPGEETSR